MSMVEHLLGRDYNLYQLFVAPEDSGHAGASRRRTYIYCSHKQTGRVLFDVFDAYARVTDAIKSIAQTSPSDYYIATKEQIYAEAARTAHVRKKPLRRVAAWSGVGECSRASGQGRRV